MSPDALLLDEAHHHLALESILWVGMAARGEGALDTSHDREFLTGVGKIIEIARRLISYSGN